MAEKKNIVIVGGGPAGLSAAFHLTQVKDWRSKYNITIYQPGWRLGGKGATGRGPKTHWRVEEHGVHGFCRFYYNTWGMMKEVYTNLRPVHHPHLMANQLPDAFLPTSFSYPISNADELYKPEPSSLLRNDGRPWCLPLAPMPKPGFLLKKLLTSITHRQNPNDALARLGRDIGQVYASSFQRLFSGGNQVKLVLAIFAARLVVDCVSEHRPVPGRLRDRLIWCFKRIQKYTHQEIKNHRNDKRGFSYRLSILDIFTATVLGILKEGYLTEPDAELDHIDDLRADVWLRMHGAHSSSMNSPAFVAVPNIMFSAPGGNDNKYPELSAASWVGWLLRSMTGDGDYYYFFQAGTGESVLVPLYLYLKDQGVKFEFFHKLRSVQIGGTKPHDLSVRSMVFERQAKVRGKDYDPLVEMELAKDPENLKWVWPNEPRWEQLVNGRRLKNSGVDFEAWDSPSKKPAPEMRSVAHGDDFHYVIFAIPPSMFPLVGLDFGPWRIANERLTTTATHAAQVWFTKSTADLGWSFKDPDLSEMPDTSRYASPTFPAPLSAMVTFDDLIEYEGWPKDNPPKGLLYVCGPIQNDPQATAGEKIIRTQTHAESMVRVLGNFMTEGRLDIEERHDSMTLNFKYVYDREGREGPQRMSYQFFKVNDDPMEAYVQAPPRSASGRMHAWNTGLTNAVAAGDWIYTGINVGAFEGAVTGGKLAAFALTGTPAIEKIKGFDFLHAGARCEVEKAEKNGTIPML